MRDITPIIRSNESRVKRAGRLRDRKYVLVQLPFKLAFAE